MTKWVGLLALTFGVKGLLAGAATPEIGPASGLAAITLLAGGLAIARGRARKK